MDIAFLAGVVCGLMGGIGIVLLIWMWVWGDK